jgi:hypothetical protein
MATRKNALEEERMTDANILKVISMLEPPEGADYKPWTKKEACQFLGMAYNTTRLGNVIESFKAKQEKDRQRRQEKRGKPATQDEIVYAVSEYLTGETVDAISKALYRSTSFVRQLLEKYNVPIRQTGHSYFSPELVPEGAMRERFALGEKVYSMRYDCVAVVEKEQSDPRYGWIYRVWLPDEKWKQHAWQPAYELASLKHLEELGVKL